MQLSENLSFCKFIKTWFIKPIIVNKEKNKFEKTIETVISVVESGEVLPLPGTLILPRNISSANIPKKEDVSRNQKSRFDILYLIYYFYFIF